MQLPAAQPMSFEIKKTDAGITLALAPDQLSVDAHEEGYVATFQSGADRFYVKLSPDLLAILGLQCVAHLPQIAPSHPTLQLEDSYRLPAKCIKSLDDRSIQRLLRECQPETIICFLWYMKDGDLIRQIFRNMSQRAAEKLMDDLEQSWHGRNPDQSSSHFVQQGRDAVLKILGLGRRLAADGQIEVPESSITAAEVDALLGGATGNE